MGFPDQDQALRISEGERTKEYRAQDSERKARGGETEGEGRDSERNWGERVLWYSHGYVLWILLSLLAQTEYREWSSYGGGAEQLRYSSLRRIHRGNVRDLDIAWTFDTGETGGLQTQPIVVDGVLFALTPSHKAFALRAATGELLWKFDSGVDSEGPNRGVMFWADGSERRLYVAVSHFLYALDAATGTAIASFGAGGRIDLREDLGRDPGKQSIQLTSPGVVYQDTLIVGGRVGESLPASPGHIRAYDARTGALRWIFHTIPHPGETGFETWSERSWIENGGANNWTGMALDEARGIVYVPTGSAAADFYGGDRKGDNLFANSLLALDAKTGQRVWHFQAVRHDILDRDFPSPPNLVTVQRQGREIDAVAQLSKHGFVFLFDRATGEPLFPMEDRPFPSSDVPGEIASRTQPVPLLPKPFARQALTKDILTTRTPSAQAWALAEFSKLTSNGPFAPLSLDRATVVFPGYDGGAEWGGAAFDPETGLLYVNANDIAWTGRLAPSHAGLGARALYLRECASCHGEDGEGAPPSIPSLAGVGSRRSRAELMAVVREGAGRMAGHPDLSNEAAQAIVEYVVTGEDKPSAEAEIATQPYRFTGYKRFLDPEGYPAVAPPWGTLNAIDLSSGEYTWKIPLGEYPELAARGLTNTGSENYGGPIVTAGGLLFIGATSYDKKFRALDKATGELLWEWTLPFAGNATPITFEAEGRQFVVIAAGGGRARDAPTGGLYVAFALPSR
jgi:quinoprotein glucose dehydrogenase